MPLNQPQGESRMAGLTPMMKQYQEIKKKYTDCILFFRLGDFYEMFFDDAKLASQELELVLTGRDCGLEERAPMCGIPYHSCEGYIARLVSRGYKVAICEQMEDPSSAQGLVKRDVIRIITPGTIIEGSMLDEGKNNYLCVLFVNDGATEAGVCFADCSTGDIHLTQITGDDVALSTSLGVITPAKYCTTMPPQLSRALPILLKKSSVLQRSRCSSNTLITSNVQTKY
jgi:DNA mismatch repair protein MutS